MANLFNKQKPAEELEHASAKTTKMAAINAGPHKYAGPGNVKSDTPGTSTEGFYNGSHNEASRIDTKRGFGKPSSVIDETPVVTPPALTGITVTLTPASIAVGAKSTLAAAPVPAGASLGTVVFTSGTAANATVSGTEATGVKAGKSIITATSGSITGTKELTVTAAAASGKPAGH